MNDDIKDLSLYGWIFTYNPYRGMWVCFHRNVDYFGGERPVEYDEDLINLIETIKKKTNERDSNG